MENDNKWFDVWLSDYCKKLRTEELTKKQEDFILLRKDE